MKKIIFCFALVCAMFFTSCTTTQFEELGRFTIISSRNIDLSRMSEMQRSFEKAKTKSYNAEGIFIRNVKLSDNYKLEAALESAMEQIPGSVAMVDASISYFRLKGFGRRQWGYRFEGTTLVDPTRVGENEILPTDGTLYFISDGKSGKVAFISEYEYNSFFN